MANTIPRHMEDHHLVMEGDNTLIFFEIKVYDTILTANQPEGYYNELVEADGFARKVLILLAPRNYYAFDDYDTRLSNVKTERTNILTKIIYWEDIAELIVKNEIETASPIFHEFYKFLDRWFKLQINLTQEDMNIIFNKQFPASLHKLTELIDGINDDFQKLGYQLKFQGSSYWEEYGYYFTTKDESTIFFGIWFDYWEKYGEPFCISMEEPTEESKSRFDQAIRK
ncbi:MAG: hypothetical protein IPK08_15785 [Bacteroidetes bacterium]|nr:hypothetical protein [Bacteroidota bacterium]